MSQPGYRNIRLTKSMLLRWIRSEMARGNHPVPEGLEVECVFQNPELIGTIGVRVSSPEWKRDPDLWPVQNQDWWDMML